MLIVFCGVDLFNNFLFQFTLQRFIKQQLFPYSCSVIPEVQEHNKAVGRNIIKRACQNYLNRVKAQQLTSQRIWFWGRRFGEGALPYLAKTGICPGDEVVTGVFRKRTTWNYMPLEAYRRGLYASHSRNIGHCTVKYVNGVEIIVKTNVTSKRSKKLRSKRFETHFLGFRTPKYDHSIATLQYKLFHIKAFVFMRLILNETSLYNRILDDNLLHNLTSERSLADFPSLEYL